MCVLSLACAEEGTEAGQTGQVGEQGSAGKKRPLRPERCSSCHRSAQKSLEASEKKSRPASCHLSFENQHGSCCLERIHWLFADSPCLISTLSFHQFTFQTVLCPATCHDPLTTQPTPHPPNKKDTLIFIHVFPEPDLSPPAQGGILATSCSIRLRCLILKLAPESFQPHLSPSRGPQPSLV